ncbi:histidine kinase [Actinoplanes sp. NPDC023801]|uniref:sensor histidine kinase n=1 Tax=Actinoplanes sp. NPDC023801 TaxID=3154595 RepID=UPI0033E3CE39
MARWTLPGLLVAGQLFYWPGWLLLDGEPVAIGRAIGVTVLCLCIGAALGLRRERPVPVLAAVFAGYCLALLIAPAEPQYGDPYDALLIIGIAEVIALFSVAVHTTLRVTLWTFAAAAVLDGAVTAAEAVASAERTSGAEVAAYLVLSLAGNGLVVALGRRRARWNSERAEAARRLDTARKAGLEAADTERRRLARELHDVTAHHLTSIVVNSSAAEMLGEQRPELRAEALDFAARTGRETLAALRQLVAIMPFAGLQDDTPSLADLAGGFRELGQRITLELPGGDPSPDRAEAVYGIVREALTNTLRYAPGSEVLVRYTDAELLVEDRGGTGTTAGLGGGRGIAGMCERAQSIGGTCEAGPVAGGGWRVRAVFPEVVGAGAAYPAPGDRTALDAAAVALALLAPVLGVVIAVEEGMTRSETVLVLLATLVHAAPMLWRRRAAWWVLAAVALTGGLGPLLTLTGQVPSGLFYVFLFGGVVDLAAVHAVASWGARPRLTALAVPGAAVPAAFWLALTFAFVAPDEESDVVVNVLFAGLMMIACTLVLSVVMLGPWGVGHAARRRRDRRRSLEEGGVAQELEQAAFRALLERRRIAVGLQEAVLRHAAAVPGAAERGDLPGVLGAAREALTAMRSLLDGLGTRTAAGPQTTRAEAAGQEVSSSRSE